MKLEEIIRRYENLADYDCYSDKQRERSEEYDEIVKYLELLKRSKTLLTATYELLKKQKSNSYVLNLLSETIYYDEAECDGSCLMDDIKAWNEEFTSILD